MSSSIAALLPSGALRAIHRHLLVWGLALQALPPAWAEAGPPPSDPSARDAALASLALPACRAALGLQPAAAAEELLRADRSLPAKLARTPACQSAAAALARLDQLERDLAASRQRVAQQQAELARETQRQEFLAKDLAQIRSQLLAPRPVAQGQPAHGAPAQGPPPQGQPALGPLAQKPLAQRPLVQRPLVQGPPAQHPPAQGPPAQGPPAQGPPAQGPLAQGPPAQGPPAQGPLAQAALAQSAPIPTDSSPQGSSPQNLPAPNAPAIASGAGGPQPAQAAAADPTTPVAAAPSTPPTPTPRGSAAAASAAPEPVSFTPGKGVTLRGGGSQLRLWAEAKLLGFSSSRYVFNPGQPLVVSPKDPDAAYDLSAQQTMVYAAFQGPKWGAWTPGAFALFTLQDNLLAEGYSFTPIAFYGEISDGHWRLVAGQNFDVFAPRDPDTLPTGKLAATGNPGAYRPQFRLERHFEAGSGFAGSLQVAASSPITTALPDQVDVANLQTEEVVEDNGWPNVEGRLSLGIGELADRSGSRRLRPVELGFSGVVGQLRVLDNIRPTDPLTLKADRSLVSVWGAAFDGQIALGRSFGLSGELYTGQGLGEYMAGIFQTYNRATNKAVPTSGGWGQVYVYPAENLRLNLGYGIDHATDSGVFGLQVNSTIFANAVWDVNAWLQLGLEGNYKLTTYDSFGDKDAWVVISEVMIRL